MSRRVKLEDLTPSQRAKVEAARARYPETLAKVEAARPEIEALAREVLAAETARIEERRPLLETLRKAREAKGLTLADVEERAGLGKAQLSRLETDFRANPTVDTLQRYAKALGLRVNIELVPERKTQVARKESLKKTRAGVKKQVKTTDK